MSALASSISILTAQIASPNGQGSWPSAGARGVFAAPGQALPERQRLVAIVLALVMLAVVLELVRRRRLREEYAFLWIGTALVLIALALQERLLTAFRDLIGAAMSTSALFFGGLVFLMLLCLQFSVRLSRLTFRNKLLSQRVALLEKEVEELVRRRDDAGVVHGTDDDTRARTADTTPAAVDSRGTP